MTWFSILKKKWPTNAQKKNKDQRLSEKEKQEKKIKSRIKRQLKDIRQQDKQE